MALDAPALAAVAAALECFGELGLGRIAEAQALRPTAAARLDALDDGALAGRLDAAYYLGFAEFFCERYDDAIRHFRRGIAVSRASGQGQFVIPMTIGLAHALRGPRPPAPRPPSTPTPPSRARACGATARCSASR